ncbi:MAG: PaaI family thioesterase [Phycisphaerales bacterium]
MSSATPVHPSAPTPASPLPQRKRTLMDRLEDSISRLTSRSTFWHRVASMIWLPYAFRSGIKIRKVDGSTFAAVLPFRRFNRNWYNAMAGASLLANAEIAGGMYIYGRCGGDWTVVCKQLSYRFLRPCFGPAIYRVNPKMDLDACLNAGREFNFDIEMDIVQQLPTRGLGREVRVGRCLATFHITPKALHEARAARRARAGTTTASQDSQA